MIYHVQNDKCLKILLYALYNNICDIESDTWEARCDFKRKWI